VNVIRTLKGHYGWITCLAFSPDGSQLAVASEHGQLRVWDLDAEEEALPRLLPGHIGVVYSVAFNNDGSVLASAGADQTIRLWDLSTPDSNHELTGHTGAVLSVAFHRDTDLRYCENTVIAILTLGARRPWLLQPRGSADRFRADYGGKAVDLSPAGGDLLVLGGRAQTNWLHAVPKVTSGARDKGRISAQWRWTSKTGMPERETNSRAPRRYSRR